MSSTATETEEDNLEFTPKVKSIDEELWRKITEFDLDGLIEEGGDVENLEEFLEPILQVHVSPKDNNSAKVTKLFEITQLLLELKNHDCEVNEENITKLEKEKGDIAQKYNQLLNEFNKIGEELKRVETGNSKMHEEHEQLKKTVKQRDKDLVLLKSKVKDYESGIPGIERANKQIQYLQEQLTIKEQKIKELIRIINELRNGKGNPLHVLDDEESACIQRKNKELEDEIENVRKDLQRELSINKEKTQIILDAEKKIEELASEIEKYQRELSQTDKMSEGRYKDLNGELEKHLSIIKQLENKNEESRKTIEQLREKYDDSETTVRALQDIIQNQKNSIREANERCSQYENDLKSLREKEEEQRLIMEKEINEKMISIDVMRKKIEELEANLKKEQSMEKDTLIENRNKKIRELEQQIERLKEAQKVADEEELQQKQIINSQKNRITFLETEIDDLRDKLSALESKIKDFERINDDIKADFETDRSEMRQNIYLLEQQIKQKQTEIDHLKAELEDTKTQLLKDRKLEKDFYYLKCKFNETGFSASSLLSEKNRYEEEILNLLKKHEQLKSTFDQLLKETVDKYDQLLEQKDKQIQRYESDLEEARERYLIDRQSNQNEHERLASKLVQKTDDKISKMLDELDEIENQTEPEPPKLSGITIDEFEEMINSKNQIIEKKNKALKTLEKRLKDLEANEKSLTQQIIELKEKSIVSKDLTHDDEIPEQSAGPEILSLELKLKEQESISKSLRKQIEEEKQKHKREIEELKEQLRNAENQVKENVISLKREHDMLLRKEIEKITKSFQKKNSKLREDLEKWKKNEQNLLEEQNTTKAEHEKMKNELLHIKQLMEKQIQTIMRCNKIEKKLKDNVEALRKELEKKENEMYKKCEKIKRDTEEMATEGQKKTLVQQKSQIQTLKEKYKQLEQQCREVNAEREKYAAMSTEYQNTIQQLRLQMQSMKENLLKFEKKELRKTHTLDEKIDLIQKLQEQLKSQKERIEQMEDKISQQKIQIQKLSETNEQKEMEIQKLETEQRNKLREHHRRHAEQISLLEEKVDKQRVQLKRMAERNEQQEIDYQEYSQQKAEIERLKKQIEGQLGDINNLEGLRDKYKDELQDIKESYEDKLKSLQDQIKKLEFDLSKSRKNTDREDNTQEKYQIIKRNCEELRIQRDALSKENQDLRAELSQFDAEFFEEIEDTKYVAAVYKKLNILYKGKLIETGCEIPRIPEEDEIKHIELDLSNL